MNAFQIPTLIMTSHQLHCSWIPGHAQPWDTKSGLPQPSQLLANLPTAPDQRLAFLIEETLLNPIKIKPESNIPKKELLDWLVWKARKTLPYSPDQTSAQFTEIQDEWIIWNLPKSWVHSCHALFDQKSQHCGLISGVLDQLTRFKQARDRALLCMFRNHWYHLEIDQKMDWQNFKMRRLPLTPENSLDLNILQADFSQLPRHKDLTFLVLDPTWDLIAPQITDHLEKWVTTKHVPLSGTTLDRLLTLSKENWP